MAIAFAMNQGFKGSTTGVTSLTCTLTNIATTGHFLASHAGGTVAVTSISDDGGNTWHLAVTDPGTNTGGTDIWYAYNIVTCQQVTVKFTATAGFCYITANEFSGVRTASDPLDVNDHDADQGTAAVSITTPDVTPTADGALIYCAGRNTGAGADTMSAPYTQLNQCGEADVDGYQIQTTATAVHGIVNNTGDTHWVVEIAAFLPPVSSTPIMEEEYQVVTPFFLPDQLVTVW